MEGLFYLILIVGIIYGYQKVLVHGVRPRRITTRLSEAELRRIFSQKVAVLGWKVVDDDNPMVAESTQWAGIQQQIGLAVSDADGKRYANITVLRYSKKIFGGLSKAHTLRMRMNAFVRAVQASDPASTVDA